MARLDDAQPNGKNSVERIAKTISRSGLCSRRDAEALIEAGRVSVNGASITSAALDVSEGDTILVDGKPIAKREAPRLWRYHKPKGRVTTHKDPEGRPTVFEALPDNLPRTISVGRLDFNTEGLLLLTNDGDLARHMELPSTGWARRYRIRAYGTVEQSALDALADGVTIERVNYGPIEAKLERDQGDNVWIAMLIREGKNREVRRIVEHLGLTVNRLIRVSFGPFILGDLEPGQVEEVKTRVLQDQLGPRLAKQMRVHREPLREERRLPVNVRNGGDPRKTYLRRKAQADGAAPSPGTDAPEERTPFVRRRRIIPLDANSGDPAIIEVVKEKPRREFDSKGKRPERDADRGSAPREKKDENKLAPSGPPRFVDRENRHEREGSQTNRGVHRSSPSPASADRKFDRPKDNSRPGRSFVAGAGREADRPTREGDRRANRTAAPAASGDRPARKFDRPRDNGMPSRSFTPRRGGGTESTQREGDSRPHRSRLEPASDSRPAPVTRLDNAPYRPAFEPRLDAGVEAPSRDRRSSFGGGSPVASAGDKLGGKFQRREGGERPRNPYKPRVSEGGERSPSERNYRRPDGAGSSREINDRSPGRSPRPPAGLKARSLEPHSGGGGGRAPHRRDTRPDTGHSPATARDEAPPKYDRPRDGDRPRSTRPASRPPLEERTGTDLRAGGRGNFRDGGQTPGGYRGSKPARNDESKGNERSFTDRRQEGRSLASKPSGRSDTPPNGTFVKPRPERGAPGTAATPARNFHTRTSGERRGEPGLNPQENRLRDAGDAGSGVYRKANFRPDRSNGKDAGTREGGGFRGRPPGREATLRSVRGDSSQGGEAKRSTQPGGFQKRQGENSAGKSRPERSFSGSGPSGTGGYRKRDPKTTGVKTSGERKRPAGDTMRSARNRPKSSEPDTP